MQAAAGRQLAGLMLSHGEETRAEQQYQMSLAICDRLLAAPARLPSTVSMKLEFERSRIVRGFAQIHYARAMHARHPDERLLHLARALERLRSLRELSESAADISSRMESAKNYNATAITLHKMGKLDEAIPIFHQAIALCDLMRTRLSDTAESPVERIAVDRLEAQILNNLTLSVHAQVRESGDWETPLALHERSRVLRQGILDRYPWMLSVRMELAQTLGNIADTLSDAPDMAREIEARRAAIDLLHTLVTEFPSSIKIREFWALHRIRWMTALHRLADDQQAVQVFQETIRVEPAPENAEPTNSGQLLDTALGWVLFVQHNPSHNETALQQAEALLLRCHSVGGFESPAVLFRLLQDPAFASVRARPAIQKLLPASPSTPPTRPEPENCNVPIQTTIM